MKEILLPETEDKKVLFDFLVKNKATLMMQKRMNGKTADAMPFINHSVFSEKDNVFKASLMLEEEDINKLLLRKEINTKVAINTTNFFDSHKDVHMPALWNKSLKEYGKMIQHLQSHNTDFPYVIADAEDLKVYTENLTWMSLGYSYPGVTEALIFESVIRKARNPLMFEQYARGWVRNHSVGMGYVKMVMCIDDEDYGAEYEAWNKYIQEVVNRKAAEDAGYFWAVNEAKVYEGSAVTRGSNVITPTISMKSKPGDHSDNNGEGEPVSSTPIDYKFLTSKIKTI